MTTTELETNTDGQTLFEKNLMSDVVNEYNTNYKKKIPFDLEKIRKSHAEGGFGITAWNNKELQERVNRLVDKGLIDDLHSGQYQISKDGTKWEDDKKPPVD